MEEVRVSEVTQEEIQFLKEAMKNEEFEKLRHDKLPNYGGYLWYFDEKDNWKKFDFVPAELKGVILGYRWAKKFRGAN